MLALIVLPLFLLAARANVSISLRTVQIVWEIKHEVDFASAGTRAVPHDIPFVFDETAYVTDVLIGTPPQHFVVRVDSGFPNFWVPDSYCQVYCAPICSDPVYCSLMCPKQCCTKSLVCTGRNRFDGFRSATYQPISAANGRRWSLTYSFMHASARGYFGSDVVKLGNASGLSIPGAVFGQATHISPAFETASYDGILGLGRPMYLDENTPLLEQAMHGLSLPSIFTISLDGLSGTIGVGSAATSGCSTTVDWAPLTSTSYYQFDARSVGFQGLKQHSPWRGWTALAGIITPFIMGPQEVVVAMAESVGALQAGAESAYYLIRCSAKLPAFLVQTSQGDIIRIVGEKLLIPTSKPGTCLLALQEVYSSGYYPQWALGEPFMQAYCAIYDVGGERFGFSPKK